MVSARLLLRAKATRRVQRALQEAETARAPRDDHPTCTGPPRGLPRRLGRRRHTCRDRSLMAPTFDEHTIQARQHPAYWSYLTTLEFTDNLIAEMDAQGVSGAELARRMGTSRAWVSRVLAGECNLTVATMGKLAFRPAAVVRADSPARSRARPTPAGWVPTDQGRPAHPSCGCRRLGRSPGRARRRCKFRRSTQRCSPAYQLESGTQGSCEVCCSAARRRRQGRPGRRRTGRCPWGSTGAGDRWCSRWCRAATALAGRRSSCLLYTSPSP